VNTHTRIPPVKWAAELSHVREISLLGTADLIFWRNRLMEVDLLPAERDGQAQLLIIAADSTYRGVKFQELSFCVLVAPQQVETRQEAAYLLQAFNSRRSFAFAERVFFSTPYDHGEVRVSASLPASFQIVKHGEVVFRAEMEADASAPVREPLRHGADGWEGPIFLPATRREAGCDGKVFFARLRGDTQTFPFLPYRDAMTIKPTRGSEILQTLVDSHFVAKEWAIRADATHAKSKTYKRAEVPARLIYNIVANSDETA
jgi:hypothetical protein